MRQQRAFRLDKELWKEYDSICVRHGDQIYYMEEAIRDIILKKKGPPEVKALVPVKVQVPKYSDKDMEFTEWAWGILDQSMDGIKKPKLDSWAKVVRLMRERDNREYLQMGEVWAWARMNTFWQSNILSMTKFREKFDTLLAQSKRPASNNGGYLTANEKAAARAAETSKLDSEDDLEF